MFMWNYILSFFSGWVAVLSENKVNSAQALAMDVAELDKRLKIKQAKDQDKQTWKMSDKQLNSVKPGFLNLIRVSQT